MDDLNELLQEIHREAHHRLPYSAVIELPMVLSDKTKKKLLTCGETPAELAEIINEAIETVNRGSIKPLDSLIERELERKLASHLTASGNPLED